MKFTQKLSKAAGSTHSYLCVGLDPYLHRIPRELKARYAQPPEQVVHFLKQVIEVTASHCAAFKPNLAFFEALGPAGLEVFREVISFIPDHKVVIADAKRGDISSTAEHYARAYFEQFEVDAITLSPLMGFEALQPFLNYDEKGVFVLALTSNPGADDFLKKPFSDHASMAEYIADHLQSINKNHAAHAGMVVGATQAKEIEAVVRHHPEAALLIPGMGAQGGNLAPFKTVLSNHKGLPLFNSSRGILYAGEGTDDWQEAVEDQAIQSKDQLNALLKTHA